MLIQRTSIWLTTHSFVKLSSGPRKYFFIFSNVAFSTSYVTFPKDNPNSCISFLDFMSDITENLIHTSDAVSSPSSTSDESQGSSRTPTPTPPKVPQKMTPPGRLDGKPKNHNLVLIPPTKSDKTPTRKCRVCVCVCVCVCEKISRNKLDVSVLSVVFLCIQKAATHDITR